MSAPTVDNFANTVRAMMLTPEQARHRQQAQQMMGVLKIATVVATATMGIFFAVFPSIFLGVLLGVTAYATYEAHRVTNNLKEIYDNALLEAQVLASQKQFADQLTKGAPISSWVIDTFRPDFSCLLS